jgi:arabinogalactan oligomer/maltooligosaccharide transport system permease protein
MIIKIAVLGLVLAIAIFGAFPLIEQQQWLGVALLVLVTAVIFWIYLSPRRIPAKYLIPGTLFLLAFQVFPVLYTMSTAFTNFGDAHRGNKQDAIQAIEGASVTKVPGSTDYRLSIATEGDPATSDLVFLLVDPETKVAQLGTPDGLEQLAADGLQFSLRNNITEAPGYTILSIGQAGAREEDLANFSVPTPNGAIVNAGLTRAFEGAPQRAYDAACDCIRDAQTGQTWTADDANGLFVDANGENLAQGWQVNVGFRNFADVLTDPLIAKYFFRTLVWNFAFAALTVAFTFALGLLVAIVLNHERLKAQRIYRSLLSCWRRTPTPRTSPSPTPGPGSWPPSPPAPGSVSATRSRSWSTPSACTSSTPTPARPSGASRPGPRRGAAGRPARRRRPATCRRSRRPGGWPDTRWRPRPRSR